MKKLLLLFLLALPGFSQIVITISSSDTLKHALSTINNNFSNLNSYKGNIFTGSGAPGTITNSVLGSVYLDTTNILEYQCWAASGPCTAVATGNWVLFTPGSGTMTTISGSGPSWLSWNIATPTTTPVITITPATGQTAGRVIGTCGAATSFAPCALVSSDLPSTAVSPGSYIAANITVDQQGRITSASTSVKGQGQVSLGTSAIASQACASVVSVSVPSVTTSDPITATFSGDPTSTTGYIPSTNGILSIFVYPTAGNVNFKVCNSTAASITPGAATINWRVP